MHTADVHAAKAGMKGAADTNVHTAKARVKPATAANVHSTEAARMKTATNGVKTAWRGGRAFRYKAQRAQRDTAGESCHKQLVHSVSSIIDAAGALLLRLRVTLLLRPRYNINK